MSTVAERTAADLLADARSRIVRYTPEDCIAAIKEYEEAGCTHVMLELWGEDRLGQLRLFAEQVLPEVRA